MASAFQSGAFQSGAFQLDGTPVANTNRGGDGGRSSSERQARRARYVRNRHFVIEQPKPEAPKSGERSIEVSKAIVREAVAQMPGWFGTVAEARQVVPTSIPLPDMRAAMERQQLIAAVRAYIEQAMQAYEAAEQAEEDDIELLLLAA
jgi:hypothetical protein